MATDKLQPSASQHGHQSLLIAGCLVLIILGAAVFAQVHRFDFVSYDDPAFVQRNAHVNQGISAEGLRWAITYSDTKGQTSPSALMHPGVENLWHPLTWISLMIDTNLWGIGNPGGFHVTSAALHIASSILVFLAFSKLFQSIAIGLITSALFLLHPLHVETAAWISERKGALSGLCFHLAFLAYLYSDQGRRRRLMLTSLAAFAFAITAKPSVVILPALLVATDWLQWRQSVKHDATTEGAAFPLLRSVGSKWPFLAVALAGALAAIYFQYAGSHAAFMEARPFSLRMQTMAASLLFYCKRTLLPFDLSFHYPFPSPENAGLFHAATWTIVLAGMVLLWRCRNRYPEWFFGGTWFTLCWLPMSGILYVGTSFTADRYVYLALTGGFAALAVSLFKRMPRPVAITVCAGLITSCAGLAYQQASHWRSSESLFASAVAHQPSDSVGYTNLAGVRQEQRNFTAAIALYKEAAALNPGSYLAVYNLGNCYRESDSLEEAEHSFQKAIRLYPEFAPAHLNLGIVYARTERLSMAATSVHKACELGNFSDPAALATLITIELKAGNIEAAREGLAKANLLPPSPDVKVRAALAAAAAAAAVAKP